MLNTDKQMQSASVIKISIILLKYHKTRNSKETSISQADSFVLNNKINFGWLKFCYTLNKLLIIVTVNISGLLRKSRQEANEL